MLLEFREKAEMNKAVPQEKRNFKISMFEWESYFLTH